MTIQDNDAPAALTAERLPVIVGIGEVTERTSAIALAREPAELMAEALRRAGRDAGADLLKDMDSLDVVCEYSWPYADACALVADRLGVRPRRSVYGVAGGESPVRFIQEAALRIARGESRVAAVVGAEANHAAAAAAKAGIVPASWTPRDPDARLMRGRDVCHPVAVRHGVTQPVHVYPFYENASQAAWGQTQGEALRESGELWSRYSRVAAGNPYSWLSKHYSPDDVITPTASNRLIAWPYTKHMVANPMVNQGAGLLLTNAAHARALGIPEDRLVYVWGGAAANEPRDYLERDSYARSVAQDAVLRRALALAGGDVTRFAMVELYSCFPVVPKMARRTLGLPADAQMTSTGGLSFFGAPLNNYMTHAAAGLVRQLRERRDRLALLYGQGEFVTKHHALVLASAAPVVNQEANDYCVQSAADAARGIVPVVRPDYTGPATLETFTVVYGRDSEVDFGVVIGLTSQCERVMARVPAHERATLAFLTDLSARPVGSRGQVSLAADGLQEWTTRP